MKSLLSPKLHLRLAANNSKLIEINTHNIQGTVYTNAHIELFRKPIAAGKSKGVLIKSIYHSSGHNAFDSVSIQSSNMK